MSDLRVGVGTSVSADTKAAVAEAVALARAALGGQAPALALVGATVDHAAPALWAALREALPGVLIHGATSSLGMLSGRGIVMGPGGGVAVQLFASAKHVAFAVGAADFTDGARAAGRRAAEKISAGTGGKTPRLLLVAATPGDEEAVLAGIGEVFPGVPVFGGSAADHAIEGAWSIFTDRGTERAGVSLAAFCSEGRELALGTAFDGPYQPTDQRAAVGEVQGRKLVRLGAEPAGAVLERWVGPAIADQVRVGGNLLVQTALSPLGVAHDTGRGSQRHGRDLPDARVARLAGGDRRRPHPSCARRRRPRCRRGARRLPHLLRWLRRHRGGPAERGHGPPARQARRRAGPRLLHLR
jgi:hypothetical protein